MLAGDRVSGTDADRHEDISHNDNCGFGDNGDSAETADLGRALITGRSQLAWWRRRPEDCLSTAIWSGVAAYLGTGLILAFLVDTYYPGALGLREWIRVVLSWPLIFFLRSK